jgi:hypothetical protein
MGCSCKVRAAGWCAGCGARGLRTGAGDAARAGRAHTLRAMTSTTNAQAIGRLKKAREQAQAKFKRQAKLLEQLETTAAERQRVNDKWSAQLAALAELAGNAAAAGELSGVGRTEIEAAAKAADRSAVDAALEAAAPAAPRRRSRTAAATVAAADAASGG